MTKRMLIDSTHAEETRVVVLDGNRLEDYDVETSTKQQLKGNIYLAKIVRVEPSLQAAFVEFGGGRHGFLAFGEIHPDYYQIPVADRKRLLELQEAEAREEEEEEEREAARRERGGSARQSEASEPLVPDEQSSEDVPPEHLDDEPAAADALTETAYAEQADPEVLHAPADEAPLYAPEPPAMPPPAQVAQPAAVAQEIVVAPAEAEALFPDAATGSMFPEEPKGLILPDEPTGSMFPDEPTGSMFPDEPTGSMFPDEPTGSMFPDEPTGATLEGVDLAPEANEDTLEHHAAPVLQAADGAADEGHAAMAAGPELQEVEQNGAVETLPQPAPEHIGGELDTDERPDRRQPSRFMRNYKIQEVMRRRQILLVQVVKEERGTKGAALTTYISLAGRFSVLMPNSPRGGGISRKITSATDRRRLKEITAELDLPRGMGLIVRTAGAARPKPEILRDCEYLLSEWDQIRDTTMRSMAPTLIYEEASLIKRAIRDVYSRDVEEILVDGEDGWRAARDFMRMLMPAHAKKVQMWRDPQPLFAKAQVESQLDSMMQPTVQLRSGGYLVINQTEALVAIDVNSGRSTRERGIEETALRTNMEAAEEAARQLRLRDLAGLIVIDFIDMESRRNNASVEKKLKDALKNDRARIQVGSISHFGLLEMSRQRLRPSLAETSSVPCPHCGGTGHLRSTESAALAVLRGIEDEGGKRRSAEIVVHVHGSIALYILNHKRVRLAEIERRAGLHVTFHADETMIPPQMRIEKIRALLESDIPVPVAALPEPDTEQDPDDAVMEADDVDTEGVEATAAEEDEDEAARPGETAEEGEQRQPKRRRRRRGGRREDARNGVADGSVVNGEAIAAAADPAEPGTMAAEPAMDAVGESIGETLESTGETVDAAVEPGAATEASTDEGMAVDGERKRRGRRGGRRRRREPGTDGSPVVDGDEPAAAEPEPSVAPASTYPPPYTPTYSPVMYTGPTPANPFGGDSNAFAFFDAVEETEHVAPVRPAPAAPILVEPAPAMTRAPEPDSVAEPVAPEPVAEPALAAPPAPEPVATAPEPATPEPPAPELDGAELAAPELALPEPDAPEPAAVPREPTGPVVGPAISPILVGAQDPDAPAAPKKQGWWRR